MHAIKAAVRVERGDEEVGVGTRFEPFGRVRALEDGVTKAGLNYLLTLDDVIASRGGIPLVEGELIGAIGCSGGTGSQDETVCTAGANTINK